MGLALRHRPGPGQGRYTGLCSGRPLPPGEPRPPQPGGGFKGISWVNGTGRGGRGEPGTLGTGPARRGRPRGRTHRLVLVLQAPRGYVRHGSAGLEAAPPPRTGPGRGTELPGQAEAGPAPAVRARDPEALPLPGLAQRPAMLGPRMPRGFGPPPRLQLPACNAPPAPHSDWPAAPRSASPRPRAGRDWLSRAAPPPPRAPIGRGGQLSR